MNTYVHTYEQCKLSMKIMKIIHRQNDSGHCGQVVTVRWSLWTGGHCGQVVTVDRWSPWTGGSYADTHTSGGSRMTAKNVAP